jgi:hypothetical protein
MKKQTKLQRIGSLVLMTIALLFITDIEAFAQKKDYKPGEKVEWNRYGYWEEVTFVGASDDGSQPIIREKPNQSYPDGYQYYATWEKIRPLSAKITNKVPVKDTEADNNAATPVTTNDFGTGLMTQEQVLGFLEAKIGDKAFTDPPREAEIKKELAEMIKARGVNFRFDSTSDFFQKLAKYGAITSEVTFPLQANYGAPTKQSWLMGAWNLGKIGAAVDYVKNNRVYRQGEIGVANVGTLTLNANGTYVWKAGAKDSTSGKWREATKEEMKDQGGDGIVLLKAKSGEDWIVMHDRWTKLKSDWIEISQLNSRWTRENGSRGGKK